LPRAKQAPPSTDETTDELLTPIELDDWRTELTEALVDELVAAGMCGAMKQDVALSCGVPPDLFEAWLDEGLRYDAPPLMRRLAVRFLGSRKKLMVAISERVISAALNGDNKMALEVLERHNPKWSRDAAQVEKENAAPELSLDVRYQLLVESFRKPRAEIRRAMLEAGITPPDAPASDSPETGPADDREGA
jgi:hypothetical protein